MSEFGPIVIATLSTLLWSVGAAAFRTCDTDNSGAFAASTKYIVGELAFDETTGLATGTETTYNYANRDFEGFSVCHVTYELSGNYEPGSSTFFLDAIRTNFSPECPSDLIEFEYPDSLMYTLQMTLDDAGALEVHTADRADFFATGSWGDGRTSYKTDETCSMF